MTSFYYYDQNPSGFCFLVQIRAFVIQTSLGLQNLNMKGKTKRILVVVVKWRHRTAFTVKQLSTEKLLPFYKIGYVSLYSSPRLCGLIVSVYGFCFSILTRRESYRCGLTFSQSQSDHQECHSTSHLESQESKLLYQKKNTKISTEPFLPGERKREVGTRGTRQ